MSAVMLAHMARGLSGDPPFDYDALTFSLDTSATRPRTVADSTGHSTRDFWGGIAAQGFQTLNQLIASRNPQPQPQPTLDIATLARIQQQTALNPTPTGIGFGVDGQGVRLSDGSHIGWPLIAGAGVVIYLLQQRPLTRK